MCVCVFLYNGFRSCWLVRFASIFDVINSHALICWTLHDWKQKRENAGFHLGEVHCTRSNQRNGMANERMKLKKNCEAIRSLIFSCVATLRLVTGSTSVQIHFISKNGKSFSYNISPLFSVLLLPPFFSSLFSSFHFFLCTFSSDFTNCMYSLCSIFFADWLRWICNGRRRTWMC